MKGSHSWLPTWEELQKKCKIRKQSCRAWLPKETLPSSCTVLVHLAGFQAPPVPTANLLQRVTCSCISSVPLLKMESPQGCPQHLLRATFLSLPSKWSILVSYRASLPFRIFSTSPIIYGCGNFYFSLLLSGVKIYFKKMQLSRTPLSLQ